MNQYKLAVFIGRFQPFHMGHSFIVNEALKIADYVLILVGSSNVPRSPKNPFTYNERLEQISSVYASDRRVEVTSIRDFTYEENQWISEVQSKIDAAGVPSEQVVIIGHSKDDSSYYLKNFKQYGQVLLPYYEIIDATQIRELFFKKKFKFIEAAVPNTVLDFLKEFSESAEYNALLHEHKFIEAYKDLWKGTPFPVIFNTVDAIVVQSGHILLIQRRSAPGKGLWAIPGGFIGPNETIQAACVRELREETRLKVAEKVLIGSLEKVDTFDSPSRSSRGRTITQVYYFKLDDSQELPLVKGSDDAIRAKWIPLSEFYDMADKMFEDHYHIIRKMIDNS